MKTHLTFAYKENAQMLRSRRGLLWLLAFSGLLSAFSLLLVSNTELSLLDNAQVVYMMSGAVVTAGALLAAILGSDAYAGEKERGTLVPLLCTPISAKLLLTGKALGNYTMRIWKYLQSAVVIIMLLASASAGAQASLTLDLLPDDKNPSIPVMGDHLRFWSTISNAGLTAVEGMVAWISLVEIDPGNEQPVDREDWSAHKAISGATLGHDQSLRTDWPMRLIKGGDYRVVVSVTIRGSNTVITSPALQFHVRQKSVLQAGRVLPVAAGVPLLIIGLLVFNKTRLRRRKEQICSRLINAYTDGLTRSPG